MNAQTGVGAERERRVLTDVWTVEPKAIGLVEDIRIAVRSSERDDDGVAGANRCVEEVDIDGGVSVDVRRCRLEPQGFLDGRRDERAVGLQRRPVLGLGQQMGEGVGGRAFRGFDAAEEDDGGVGGKVVVGKR